MLLFIICGAFSLATASNWDYATDLEKCSKYGPNYWCLTAKHAKSCHATSYCEEHMWSKMLQTEGKEDLCTTCEQYVGTVHMLLANNATEAEILQAMKEACSILPTLIQGLCSEAVDLYGQELIQAVVQYTADPKQFCTLIHLCSSTRTSKLPHLKSGTDYCLTCQQYLGTLHLIISNAETQKEIISTMQSLCSYVPKTYSSECSALIGMAAPYLLKWLVQYTADPSKFCTTIGLCSSYQIPLVRQQNKDVLELSRSVYDTPGPDVFPKEQKKSNVAKDVTKKKKPVEQLDGAYCDTCLQIVKMVDERLEDKPTKDEIRKLLDEACSVVGAYSTECRAVVDAYANEIIDAFVKGVLQPDEICMLIKLCPSLKRKKLSVKATLLRSIKKTHEIKNEVTCELCQYVASYLDNQLKDNRTETAIQKAMETVCGYLPSQYKDECDTFVDTYSQTLIQLLIQQLDPSVICKELSLCATVKGGQPAAAKSSVKNEVECEVCQYAMGYLDNILKENKTKEAIEDALEKMCGYLPSQYKDECDQLVKSYGPIITELLIQQLDQNVICKELNLCSTVRVKETIACEVCQYAMGYLDALLSKNATKEEIKNGVEKLCTYLPQYLNTQCEGLVNQYSDMIIELLMKELDPSAVCHAIKVCTDSYRKVQQYLRAVQLSLEGPSCTVCEYAMGYLDAKLDSEPVKKDIEGLVEKLCSYLPSSFKNECDALITEYGDQMIDLLVQQLKPDTICKELHVC